MSDEQTATRGKAARPPLTAVSQMPWSIPRLIDRPVDPLDPEGVARLDAGVMRILADIGVDLQNGDAAIALRRAGCRVTGTTVRFDPAFVAEKLALVPRSFTITPRNPARAIPVGDGHLLFGCVSSAPNAWDLERGKRSGDRAAFREMLALAQHFNCIHFLGGYPVEPADVPAASRHSECMAEMLTRTDKVCHAYSLNAAQAEDAMEMVRLAAGLSSGEFAAAPRMFTNINSLSPLRYEGAVLDAAMRFARQGQPVIVTPFAVAGATAPVTLAGAVALALAEGLAVITLLQVIQPGCPVMLGGLSPSADLKTGAPVYGTPEYIRATQMTGQMARHYGLPLRGSAPSNAPVPDGQSMAETSNAVWAALQAGSAMIYHAAGWLESGLMASPEKFLMDCEMLQGIQRYCDAGLLATDPTALALDLLRDVGAGGHFFGTRQTQDRVGSVPRPFLSELRPYEAWHQDGAAWSSERAHRLYPRLLEECIAPPMADAARGALEEFVADRRQAAGIPVAA